MPGEVILKFKPEADSLDVTTVRSALNATELGEFASGAKYWRLRPGDEVEDAVAWLSGDQKVEYAEPNYELELYATTPNDPNFDLQWGLKNTGQTMPSCSPTLPSTCTPDADIDADEAWDITTGGPSVEIAVIDIGVGYHHVEIPLWNNPGEIAGDSIDNDNNGYVDDWRGWDFYGNGTGTPDNDPLDETAIQHGTQIGSVAGALSNNGSGMAGVIWGTSIMALRTGSNTINTASAIQAIDYAAAMRADVINASWGGGPFSQALKDAITGAHVKEVLFVNAAGNSTCDIDSGAPSCVDNKYPQKFDNKNILVVAGTDCNDSRIPASNWGGISVDIAAPGNGIFAALWNAASSSSQYTYCFKGTSAAAPHVAGVAALVRAVKPSIPAESIKGLILQRSDLLSSASGLGPGKTVTGGRLNARKVVENQDTISPTPISNLAASTNAPASMNLTWTASGDTYADGTATFYDVRYSTTPITADNWDTRSRTFNEPVPLPSGTTQAMTATGLPQGTCYYWAMRGYDEWGNGPTSNMAKCGTRPSVCIAEYCKPVGETYHRCTFNNSYGSCGCCSYTCVPDETCEGGEPPPPTACGYYCL